MFKVGDRVKLKEGLKEGEVYGDVEYLEVKYFGETRQITAIDSEGDCLLGDSRLWYSQEMLELVESKWEETSKEWVWNGECLFNIDNEKLIKFDEKHKTLTYSNNCACYDFKQKATHQDLENLARKLGAIRI